MNEQKTAIVIQDETILSYYRENPHIDIVAINHVFIDILKNLSTNLSTTLHSTINSQILSIVSNIDKNLPLLKSDLLLKLADSKREYLDDLRTTLANHSSSTHEKLGHSIERLEHSIERNNDLLLSKVKLTLDDLLPKSQEHNYQQIEGCVKNAFALLSQDTRHLMDAVKANKDDSTLKTFLDNIDNHLSNMLTNLQQPLFSSIKSSEERTNQGLQQLKENVLLQQNIQETLRNEMHDFLNKYKNSSHFKGNVAEVELQHILLSLMPSDEVVRVGSDPASCDLRVNRKDSTKPSILFESKNYNRSATTAEVKKFERDVQQQNTHGIFISHDSPITFKDNFQIDIINGLIHVYIPNANYQADKIKIAVDIVDHLAFRLGVMSKQSDNEFSLGKEELDEITEEYKIFGIQKAQMLETIKTVNKQLIDRLEEIQFPKIKKLLIRLGHVENDNDFKCPLCNNWSGKNKASLGAHMRSCKFNSKRFKEATLDDLDMEVIRENEILDANTETEVVLEPSTLEIQPAPPTTHEKKRKSTSSKKKI